VTTDLAADRAVRFLALHQIGQPLLLPNPWDVGTARVLASLGFQALATTSSGFAATLGRNDGSVTADEALTHASAIVAATELPVSADLENGFAADPADIATIVRRAVSVGLAVALSRTIQATWIPRSMTADLRSTESWRPSMRPTMARIESC